MPLDVKEDGEVVRGWGEACPSLSSCVLCEWSFLFVAFVFVSVSVAVVLVFLYLQIHIPGISVLTDGLVYFSRQPHLDTRRRSRLETRRPPQRSESSTSDF